MLDLSLRDFILGHRAQDASHPDVVEGLHVLLTVWIVAKDNVRVADFLKLEGALEVSLALVDHPVDDVDSVRIELLT